MRKLLVLFVLAVTFQSAHASLEIYDSATGKYLGNLNANQYDPNSISNPYGKYGSRYSPDSINNPYSQYGSRYNLDSQNNLYAVPSQDGSRYILDSINNTYTIPSIRWDNMRR